MTNEKEANGIGFIEIADVSGKKRMFASAILGDGWVGVSEGTWGGMGIVQIVPLRKRHSVEHGPPPESKRAERLSQIDDGPGIMICFRSRVDVVAMVATLTQVLTQMPAKEAE